jgi:hypothetical protein
MDVGFIAHIINVNIWYMDPPILKKKGVFKKKENFLKAFSIIAYMLQ